jgi:hypothetical protein
MNPNARVVKNLGQIAVLRRHDDMPVFIICGIECCDRDYVREGRERRLGNMNPDAQLREVEREDQREKRLEETEEGMVADMPRPGLRHRPQSAGIAEGDLRGPGVEYLPAAVNRVRNRLHHP